MLQSTLPLHDSQTESTPATVMTARQSLIDNSESGHILSLCYGAPKEERDYPGGQQYWLDLSNGRGSYKFTKGHRNLCRQENASIAKSIFGHLDPELSKSTPWHFTTVTPGGDFSSQDGLIIEAIDTYAEEHSLGRVEYGTVAEQNDSYRSDAVRSSIETFELKAPPKETGHNVFSEPLGDINKDFDENRISIVVWSGGTVGNVGKKNDQDGYPDEGIIDVLHKQVDWGAKKCIVVVLHNDFRDAAVTGYYSDELNDKFLLSGLTEIRDTLGLTDEQLNPSQFYCERRYNPITETVEHIILSKKDQMIEIGDRLRRLQAGQIVNIAGLSTQISPERMDDIISRGGFSRITSAFQTVNGNPKSFVRATVMLAQDNLMQALREGRKYRNGPLYTA